MLYKVEVVGAVKIKGFSKGWVMKSAHTAEITGKTTSDSTIGSLLEIDEFINAALKRLNIIRADVSIKLADLESCKVEKHFSNNENTVAWLGTHETEEDSDTDCSEISESINNESKVKVLIYVKSGLM